MEMVEVKTSDLIGVALDWAVLISIQETPFDEETLVAFFNAVKHYRFTMVTKYSTDWGQGGPLIEKLLATGKWEVVQGAKDGTVWVQNYDKDCVPVDGESLDQRNMYFESESLLIAACRAIVAAKLGDTVQVPAELLSNG